MINMKSRLQGVPFANPPVRFAPPEPKTPWTGDLNATRFKPACTQVAEMFIIPFAVRPDVLYILGAEF